jgi:hypothetical protein
MLPPVMQASAPPADLGRSEVLDRVLALHSGILEDMRVIRERQVSVAARLLELQRLDSFPSLGASTFPLYCERYGISAQEGRDLATLARVAQSFPRVVPMVAAGALPVQRVAAVAPVLLDASLRLPGEDWVATAAGNTTSEVRDMVQRRREEARRPGPLVPLRFHVTRRGADDFRRCRDLLLRRPGEIPTDGQAFEAVCDHFLECKDPERKARRLEAKDGATAPFPEEGASRGAGVRGRRRRSLAARVKREVLRPFGDRCRVKGCGERGLLYFAHLRPVRAGGASGPRDLVRLCLDHHRQYDRGDWRIVRKRDGTLVMIGSNGVPVDRFRRPGDDLPVARPPPETG